MSASDRVPSGTPPTQPASAIDAAAYVLDTTECVYETRTERNRQMAEALHQAGLLRSPDPVRPPEPQAAELHDAIVDFIAADDARCENEDEVPGEAWNRAYLGLRALADRGRPSASTESPILAPVAVSEASSGQQEPTVLSEAEIAAIAAEYVALFDEIADEVGMQRMLAPADGGVAAVARLVQAFGRAGFGVMRRSARPEYIDATDCPICPMLATDRDDALAEAAAARDEIDRLHAENERLKSGGDELWPNAEDILRRRPVVMLTATMYSLLRSELERLRALEASGALSDTQSPAGASLRTRIIEVLRSPAREYEEYAEGEVYEFFDTTEDLAGVLALALAAGGEP